MLGLPAYSSSVNDIPLHYGDWLLASLVLITIGIEFTADNQQWAFHNYKRDGKVDHAEEWPGARLNFTQDDAQRGFLTRGLWYVLPVLQFCSMSLFFFLLGPTLATPMQRLNVRDLSLLKYTTPHTNRCTEFVWFLMSLFPLLTHPHIAHNVFDFAALLSPSLLLSALIYSSTIFTESISEPKYPGYKYYQRRVAMFWPLDTTFKALWVRVVGGKKEKAIVDEFLWGDVLAAPERKLVKDE